MEDWQHWASMFSLGLEQGFFLCPVSCHPLPPLQSPPDLLAQVNKQPAGPSASFPGGWHPARHTALLFPFRNAQKDWQLCKICLVWGGFGCLTVEEMLACSSQHLCAPSHLPPASSLGVLCVCWEGEAWKHRMEQLCCPWAQPDTLVLLSKAVGKCVETGGEKKHKQPFVESHS